MILLRRATFELPAAQRRWVKPPVGLPDVRPLLRQMCDRGEIKPLEGVRDLYEVTVPYAQMGPIDAEEVLMEVNPNAALAYLSALRFHELTLMLPRQYSMVVPERGSEAPLPVGTSNADWSDLGVVFWRPAAHVCGVPVDWRRLPAARSFGLDVYQPRGYPVRVTSPERTLLDGLLEPDRCGGLDNVLRAWVVGLDRLNLDIVVDFTERFGVAVLRQRVGFVVEELGVKHPAIDGWQRRARRGGSSRLLGSAAYAGTYSERWSLSINAPIGALHEALG